MKNYKEFMALRKALGRYIASIPENERGYDINRLIGQVSARKMKPALHNEGRPDVGMFARRIMARRFPMLDVSVAFGRCDVIRRKERGNKYSYKVFIGHLWKKNVHDIFYEGKRMLQGDDMVFIVQAKLIKTNQKEFDVYSTLIFQSGGADNLVPRYAAAAKTSGGFAFGKTISAAIDGAKIKTVEYFEEKMKGE